MQLQGEISTPLPQSHSHWGSAMVSMPPSWRSYPCPPGIAGCIPGPTDRVPNSESLPHKSGKMGQVPALIDGLSRGNLPGLEGKSQHLLVDALVTDVSLPFEDSSGKSWDPLVEFLEARAVSSLLGQRGQVLWPVGGITSLGSSLCLFESVEGVVLGPTGKI